MIWLWIAIVLIFAAYAAGHARGTAETTRYYERHYELRHRSYEEMCRWIRENEQ